MRKKMTVAVLSMMAIVALVFVIGLFLPKQRVFVKTASLKSPLGKVFQIVTDVEKQASWRADVQAIKVIDQNTWTEIPKKGRSITFKTKQKIQNQIFEIEIIEPKSFQGYGVGQFEQTTTGTKVLFKEVITIDNPFLRVMSFLFLDLDQTMEVYMGNLKSKLGE